MAAETVLARPCAAAGPLTRNLDSWTRRLDQGLCPLSSEAQAPLPYQCQSRGAVSATLSMPWRATAIAQRCLFHVPSASQTTTAAAAAEARGLVAVAARSPFPTRGSTPAWHAASPMVDSARPTPAESSSLRLRAQLKAVSAQAILIPSLSACGLGEAFLTRTASSFHAASQSRAQFAASDSPRQLSAVHSWRQLSPASQRRSTTASSICGAFFIKLRSFASASTPQNPPRVQPTLRHVSPPRGAPAPPPWPQTRLPGAESTAAQRTAAVPDAATVPEASTVPETALSSSDTSGAGVAGSGTGDASNGAQGGEAVPKPRRRKATQEAADPQGPAAGTPKPRKAPADPEVSPEASPEASPDTPTPRAKEEAATGDSLGTPKAKRAATGGVRRAPKTTNAATADTPGTTAGTTAGTPPDTPAVTPAGTPAGNGGLGRSRKAAAGSASGAPRARKGAAAPRAKRVVKIVERGDGTTADGFLGESLLGGLHPLLYRGLSLAAERLRASQSSASETASGALGPSDDPQDSNEYSSTVHSGSSDDSRTANGSVQSSTTSGDSTICADAFYSRGRRILGVGIDPDVSGALAVLWARTAQQGDWCQLPLTVPDPTTEQGAAAAAGGSVAVAVAAAAAAEKPAAATTPAAALTPPEAAAMTPPEAAATPQSSPDRGAASLHALFGVQICDVPFHLEQVNGKSRKRHSPAGIAALLRSLELPPGCPVFIEHSRPIHTDGKQGWYSSGFGYGVWLGAVSALGLAAEPVLAQRWKKAAGAVMGHVGMPEARPGVKDDNRQLATVLFPFAAPAVKRKKDHGRAEAVLIAMYASSLLHEMDANSGVDLSVPVEDEEVDDEDDVSSEESHAQT